MQKIWLLIKKISDILLYAGAFLKHRLYKAKLSSQNNITNDAIERQRSIEKMVMEPINNLNK